MRYVAVMMIVLVFAVCALAPAVAAEDVVKVKCTAEEKGAVKRVILNAYVMGCHQEWDAAKMAEGFHPDFVLPMLTKGKITPLPLADWLESLRKRKRENPDGPDHRMTHKFTMVDVVGTAAMVRLELYRDGKHVFSDYLSLYRFPDGWKIVGKIYHRHP